MNRPRKLIITTIVIAAGAGASLHLAKLHGQPVRIPQIHRSHAVPSGFPGYATPEQTLQSLGWAAGTDDLELIRDSVTPEIQNMMRSHSGPDAVAHFTSMATLLGGASVLRREALSGDEVLLHVQPAGYQAPWKVRMHKTGQTWKLSGIEH